MALLEVVRNRLPAGTDAEATAHAAAIEAAHAMGLLDDVAVHTWAATVDDSVTH
jgi:hypothetical protein